MTNNQVYPQLTEIFRDVFDDDALELRPDMTAKDIEGWDSFNHINLLVAIEARFGIKFNTAELESLRNVGHLAEVITTKAA